MVTAINSSNNALGNLSNITEDNAKLFYAACKEVNNEMYYSFNHFQTFTEWMKTVIVNYFASNNIQSIQVGLTNTFLILRNCNVYLKQNQ